MARAKQEQMTRRFFAAIVAILGLTPLTFGILCYHYHPGGIDGVENMPCTGICTPRYVDCPTSDSCTSWHIAGLANCPCTTVTRSCQWFVGGWVNPVTGCCEGGLPSNPAALTVTITVCTPSGSCGWTNPVED